MTIRSLVLMAITLAAGLTVVVSPALALTAAMVVLTAWALVSFLRWREAFRHRPTAEFAFAQARRRARDARQN